MDIRSGKFIVIEGSDGSGKKTQFELLSSRLQAAGFHVEMFDFPRYEQTSSHFVRKYLAGEYGESDTINPYTASMFYALDRYEASFEIRRSLTAGHIVLANRFVGSNMAHQGAKFGTEGEKRGFFMWEDSLEFQLLGIPRPDLNIYLKVPAKVSQELIIKRSKDSGVPLDEHEKDLCFLSRSVESYDLLCKLFPKDYILIDCTKKGQLLPIPKISDQLWQRIQPLLVGVTKGRPKQLSHLIKDSSHTKNNQNVIKQPEITKEAVVKVTILDALQSGSNVDYAYDRINFETSPKLQALLKQYGPQYQKLEKTISHFENVFTKKLSNLHLTSSKTRNVKNQVLWSLLPNYVLGTSNEAIKNEIPDGLFDENLNKQVESLTGSVSAYQPAKEVESKLVNVISVLPRNELDLLLPVVFSLNIANAQSLQDDLDETDYQARSKLFNQILTSRGTLSNDIVQKSTLYQFELNCSLAQVNQFLKFTKPKNIICQSLSPMLGYSIPRVIDDLDIAEEYSVCFDESVALFSHIQKGHGNALAAYALLGGHKQRFLLNLDLFNIVSLIKEQNNKKSVSGFIRATTKELLIVINELHPLIGDFLNTQNKSTKKTKKD